MDVDTVKGLIEFYVNIVPKIGDGPMPDDIKEECKKYIEVFKKALPHFVGQVSKNLEADVAQVKGFEEILPNDMRLIRYVYGSNTDRIMELETRLGTASAKISNLQFVCDGLAKRNVYLSKRIVYLTDKLKRENCI